MTRSTIHATWLALTLSLACGVDEHEDRRCDDETPCDAGSTCYRGFCVLERCAPGEERACFDGPAELIGIGSCREGTLTCGDDGLFGACVDQVLPRTEMCNGRDDDCDGFVDEIAGTSCDTRLRGVCAMGELACTEAGAVCQATREPTEEVCNGLDDDCDGVVDEGLDGRPCYDFEPGEGDALGCVEDEDGFTCTGVCRPGRTQCEEGTLTCVDQITPTPELCTAEGDDPADESCDGEIDEGCPCIEGETRACYGGPPGTLDVGPCRAGAQTCTAEGRWGVCEGDVRPRPETCANQGVDDDCNGAVDDIPRLGDSCVADALGECARGTFACDEATLRCLPGAATPELCNGLDDDCDGVVDNATSDCAGTCCGADLCVDRTLDPAHCGECFRACPTGNVCTNGQCCPEGHIFCGGNCIDPMTNRNHCGRCGNNCALLIIPTQCRMGSC
ncbi:MAG: hypothetical protein KF901_16945 [Myxococcales bacterium]|nr:hypothetical protein [Myxococcales bacterium]